MAKKTVTVVRNAGTGRFVKPSKAVTAPKTHVKETMKKGK